MKNEVLHDKNKVCQREKEREDLKRSQEKGVGRLICNAIAQFE